MPWGLQVRDGMQLAVDEINADGGVDGRPLELEVADDQMSPEEGVAGVERLVDEGVVAIGGVISSDVGLATARAAEESETPLFLVKAGNEQILPRDSRYTFPHLPAGGADGGRADRPVRRGGSDRVGAIITDYGWGQAFRAAAEEEFGALDGVELRVEVAPVDETDFTTYLRNLESFDPELIVATGHPPGPGRSPCSRRISAWTSRSRAPTPCSEVVSAAGDAATGHYRLRLCRLRERGVPGSGPPLPGASDNTFMDDARWPATGSSRWSPKPSRGGGRRPRRSPSTSTSETFDLPGYAFEMGWTEWGELAAPSRSSR